MQIYQILNKVTKKSYIGKSKNYQKRFQNHIKAAEKKRNARLYDSMNCHGIDNFELILLEELGDVSEQMVDDRETFWIKTLNTLIPNGYNMTEGGDGGYTLTFWTEEEKKELYQTQADKRKGQKRSESTKKLLKDLAIERERNKSQEQKNIISAKISKTNKEKGISPPEYTKWKKGQVGTFSGKQHSESAKIKLSVARKGKTYISLYGEEKANEEKQKRKQRWLGNNNPNHINFAEDTKVLALNILANGKIKISDLCKQINMTEYKIRQWLREIGVDNYQKLGYTLANEEWCDFWRNKC